MRDDVREKSAVKKRNNSQNCEESKSIHSSFCLSVVFLALPNKTLKPSFSSKLCNEDDDEEEEVDEFVSSNAI